MHFHAEPKDHPICVWERHLERRATPRLCRSTVVKIDTNFCCGAARRADDSG
jgi:hypothetical protein